MKAKDLDKLFDSGEVDITPYLELSKLACPHYQQKRVNIDFPEWLLQKIDTLAQKMGVPRQSLIKVLLAERFKQAAKG